MYYICLLYDVIHMYHVCLLYDVIHMYHVYVHGLYLARIYYIPSLRSHVVVLKTMLFVRELATYMYPTYFSKVSSKSCLAA